MFRQRTESRARTDGTAPRKRRPLVYRLIRAALLGYAVVLLMLGLIQRYLIYQPARETAIEPSHARLTAGRVHALSAKTEDGLTLSGWHILPEGVTQTCEADCDVHLAGGGPVILYFSGNAANRRYRIPTFQALATTGADVFIFDYRGYGENPGKPTELGLRADARAAWDYATRTRGIPAERIVLCGESLGGGVATGLASELSHRGTPPGGLVLTSTFSSLADAGSYHYPWIPVRWLLLDRYPSIDLIGQVSCPILVIHGRQDTIVPIAMGRRLYDAAPDKSAGGVTKLFVELPNADHNDVVHAEYDRYRAAFSAFFESVRPPRNGTPQPSETSAAR